MRKASSLSTSALALISISAILSIRSLPLTAHVGLEAVGFYILAAIGFLLPSSLVCAHLASHVKANGGIYGWVQAAFGSKAGFIAIWMEWINNVIGFPATLSTVSATVLFVAMPSLSHHRWILFGLMMIVLWGLTAFNALGIKSSSRLSMLGALFGTIVPGLLVIILGFDWVLSGHAIGFMHDHTDLFPRFSFSDMALFVAVLGAYSGMQVTAFHAKNVAEPKRQFPKAIAIACIAILILSIGATLALSAVVAPTKMNVISGVIQMFSVFFGVNNVGWILPIFIALIAFGMIASLSNWMLGPARGMQVAVSEGHLPKHFAKLNKHEMPINILLVQAFVATGLASVFIWMPTLEEAFWVLIALTSQFTVLMYSMVFVSCLFLSFSQEHHPGGAKHPSGSIRSEVGRISSYVIRQKVLMPVYASLNRPTNAGLDPRLREDDTFKIPFGRPGAFVICLIGLVSCLAGFIVGLFPPSGIGIQSEPHYVIMMLTVDAVIIGLPFLLNCKIIK